MRLIEADALKEPLIDEYKKLNDVFNETSVFKAPNDVALYGALMQEVGAVIGAIDALPTVDAVPVVHGKWIHRHGTWFHNDYQCSECGNYLDFNGLNAGRGDANYCPHCGARMEAE